MTGTTVHLAVYDTFADWEPGFATAQLTRYGRTVRTVGLTAAPVTTRGGMRVQPGLPLDGLAPGDSELLILTSAFLWDRGDALAPFARAARTFLDAGVPVAAICGATAGPAREDLLDGRSHTSAAPWYLAATRYAGGAHHVEADAVTDDGGKPDAGGTPRGALVTAGPAEPVAFAREILGLLGVFEPEKLDAWYRLFHDSDTSAYEVLEG